MALRMPYKAESLDMILVLPNEKSSLESVENKMQALDLSQAEARNTTRAAA